MKTVIHCIIFVTLVIQSREMVAICTVNRLSDLFYFLPKQLNSVVIGKWLESTSNSMAYWNL